MQQQITAWLVATGDYETGLRLLRETGYTGFALGVLAMGEDSYTRGKLETELQAWLSKQNTILPAVPPTAPADPAAVPESLASMPVPPPPADQRPAGVEAIQREIYQLMDQRTEAKAWIRAGEHLGNSDEAQATRRPYAYQVKTLTLRIDELYSQLDFFEQYGYLPSQVSDPEIDETVLLMNMRSYVSKYKNKLKKTNLTPEQRQDYQALYEKYLAEKLRLELKRTNPVP